MWNNKQVDPSAELLGLLREGIDVLVRPKENNVHNRFFVRDHVTTSAVFMVDDDLLLPQKSIEAAFDAWLAEPDRIVGFFPRTFERINASVESYRYTSTTWPGPQRAPASSLNYSIVIRAYIVKASYLSAAVEKLGSSGFLKSLHCDDLLMNFIVSSLASLPPLLVSSSFTDVMVDDWESQNVNLECRTTGPETMAKTGSRRRLPPCSSGNATVGLSNAPFWSIQRSECLDTLTRSFGEMPLLATSNVVRAEGCFCESKKRGCEPSCPHFDVYSAMLQGRKKRASPQFSESTFIDPIYRLVRSKEYDDSFYASTMASDFDTGLVQFPKGFGPLRGTLPERDSPSMFLFTTLRADSAESAALLQRFLEHYFRLGVPFNQMYITLHTALESGMEKSTTRFAIEKIMDARRVWYNTWIGDFVPRIALFHRFLLQQQRVRTKDWIVSVDIDEHLRLPDWIGTSLNSPSLQDLVALLGDTGFNAVKTVMVDRVSRSGELLKPKETGPLLREQYPLLCSITGPVAGGLSYKITVHSGALRTTGGGHNIATEYFFRKRLFRRLAFDTTHPARVFPTTFSLDHFKWHSGVLGLLQERNASYFSKGMGFWKESDRLIRSLEDPLKCASPSSMR